MRETDAVENLLEVLRREPSDGPALTRLGEIVGVEARSDRATSVQIQEKAGDLVLARRAAMKNQALPETQKRYFVGLLKKSEGYLELELERNRQREGWWDQALEDWSLGGGVGVGESLVDGKSLVRLAEREVNRGQDLKAGMGKIERGILLLESQIEDDRVVLEQARERLAEYAARKPNSPNSGIYDSARGHSGAPRHQTITVEPGYNLVSVCLVKGGNTITDLFPDVPEGTRLQFVGGGFQGRGSYRFDAEKGWDDSFGVVVDPGRGIFIEANGSFTIDVEGSEFLVDEPRFLGEGQHMIGSLKPGDTDFENLVGRAPLVGETVFRYSGFPPNHISFEWKYEAEGWQPDAPLITEGQAVFVKLVAPNYPSMPINPE